MKNHLSIVATCMLCLMLVACGPSVSQENYDKVHNDMNAEEVNDILGKPTEVASFGLGEFSATTAKWVGKTHTVTVTFANDQVKMKTYSENAASEQK